MIPEIKPYEWQIPLIAGARDSIVRDGVFVNGAPTGSGKTVVSLATAGSLECPVLVIAPKIALTQWRRTADRMGLADRMIGITNPEQISKPGGCEFYTRDRKWALPRGCHVIWDEPHRNASGINGVTTQALAELKLYRSSGVTLHAMSATLADSPLKLRAIGFWGNLHQFHKPSFFGWCRAHGCRDEELGWGSGRYVLKFTKNKVLSREYMEQIRRDFGTKFHAFDPSLIPGFPDQRITVELVDLSKRDRAEIDAAYAEMSDRMKSPVVAKTPGAQAMAAIAEMGRERERVEYVMAEALAELAAADVEDGNSSVVFLNFTEPRLRFAAKFREKAGFEPCQIHGGQSDTDRTRAKDLFQANECACIAVNIQAGGAALDLHDERHERPRVSRLIPTWKANDIKQCFGRIRRCNGTFATHKLMLAAGTIQERVAATLQRNLANIDAFNLCDADLAP